MDVRHERQKREEGVGVGYDYPHSHPGAFVRQDYLPPQLTGSRFYHPSNRGREGKLAERLRALWPERFGEPTADEENMGDG